MGGGTFIRRGGQWGSSKSVLSNMVAIYLELIQFLSHTSVNSYTALVASRLDTADYRTFPSSQKVLWDSYFSFLFSLFPSPSPSPYQTAIFLECSKILLRSLCGEEQLFTLSNGDSSVTIREQSHLTHLLSDAPLCHTDKTLGRGPSALAVPHTWSHFLDGSSQNHCKSQQIKYLSKLLNDSKWLAMKILRGAVDG